MAEEPSTLYTVVSSVVESALGCTPNEIFWVKIVGEVAAKFQKLEERCS
jgi:hypothetical protein